MLFIDLEYNIYICNLAERVFDMADNQNMFYGDASNIQIQQDAINSTQMQSINQECDYTEPLRLLRQLQENIVSLGLDDAGQIEAKRLIETVESSIAKKEPHSKIKQGLNLLKEFLMRTTTTLAATGAVTLISNLISSLQ